MNFHAKTIEKYRRIMYNIRKMGYSAQKNAGTSRSKPILNPIPSGFKEKNGLIQSGKGAVCLFFERGTFPSDDFLLSVVSALKSKKIKAKIIISDGDDYSRVKNESLVVVRGGKKSGVVCGVIPGRTEYRFCLKDGVAPCDYAEKVLSFMREKNRFNFGSDGQSVFHEFYSETEPEAFCLSLTAASIEADRQSGCFNMIEVVSHSLPFSSDGLLADIFRKCGADVIPTENQSPVGINERKGRSVLVQISDVGFTDTLLKFTEAVNG